MKEFDSYHIRAALKDNLADNEMVDYIMYCVGNKEKFEQCNKLLMKVLELCDGAEHDKLKTTILEFFAENGIATNK